VHDVQITLTTTGRRSGQQRPVTLYAWEDRDGLVVVGSRGGAADDPAWVVNMRAHPRATVRRGGQTIPVEAHEIDGQERERLWQLVVDRFPLYETYQRRTKRRIPLFVLTPIE
jgi:deazaflavin-dependent oxidoreductase (nitroreductase family)